MRTVREALAEAGAAGRSAEAASALAAHAARARTPAVAKALTGVAGWVAAFLFVAFLVAADIVHDEAGAYVVGPILLGVALVLRRKLPEAVFAGQLALALSIAGEALLAYGFAETFDEEGAAIGIIVLEAALIALYPDPVHRFLSTLAIVGSAVFLLFEFHAREALPALAVVCAFAADALLARESRIAARGLGPVLEPVAYGLAVAAIAILVPSGLGELDRDLHAIPWWTAAAGLAVALALAVRRIVRGLDGSPAQVAEALVLVALVAAPAILAPGILAAALFLLAGHERGNALLMSLAGAALAFFIGTFYYSLEITLLAKSAALAGTGIAILGARWILVRRLEAPGPRPAPAPAAAPARRGGLALAAAAALALAVPASLVAAKERLVAEGEVVLLELAPRDPRSLMQGDYMVLRYALEREIDRDAAPRDGRVVLALDEHGVGRFARIDHGRPLGPRERLLRYRIRGRDVRLGAEAFFFEEGTAKVYDAARYGELRVAPDGASVLTGLRDADRRRLGRDPFGR